MESDTISIEVFDATNLKTTQLIKIKNFPTIVRTSEQNIKLEHEFRINDRFTGHFTFYPLGAKTLGTFISMALEIESDSSYEYYGDVNMSILGADGKNYFLKKSLWAVYDGAPIQELLDAKYLIGGVLQIQIDIRLNYDYIENLNFRDYRGFLRAALRSDIYGNMVVKVQDHFDFHVDNYVIHRYYKTYNLKPIGKKDSHDRPIYELADADPYVFQWSLVNTYMYEAHMGGVNAG